MRKREKDTVYTGVRAAFFFSHNFDEVWPLHVTKAFGLRWRLVHILDLQLYYCIRGQHAAHAIQQRHAEVHSVRKFANACARHWGTERDCFSAENFFFLQNFGLPSWRCGLTWVRPLHKSIRQLLCNASMIGLGEGNHCRIIQKVCMPCSSAVLIRQNNALCKSTARLKTQKTVEGWCRLHIRHKLQ